ncbi:MAG: beta-galactosidase [bacterium]|nr:beta-galactosidase [bacterium]
MAWIKKILYSLAALVIFLIWAVFLLTVYGFYKNPPSADLQFGVNFSKKQALRFNLDWRKTYLEILDDLNVKFVRLAAYWDEIEPEEGNYNFSDLDWQIEEARKRNAKIILAVGLRLPRWPECHAPQWARIQNEELRIKNLIRYIEETVKHYQEFNNIVAWQVENEPFLRGFGECPALNVKLLGKEIALVKSLDSRPIVITDSGELGDWFRSYRRADIFGTTMYRKVWSDKISGFFRYPLPPAFFWWRQGTVNFFLGRKEIIGVELQAEAWGPGRQIYDMRPDEIKDFFSAAEMLESIDYSRRVGLPINYLWGAEWWAWMKENGHPQYWNLAKTVF